VRAAAEVLLWLAAVAGVLWLMVLVELLGGTEDTAAEGYAPVADGLLPLAAGLAPGLLVPPVSPWARRGGPLAGPAPLPCSRGCSWWRPGSASG